MWQEKLNAGQLRLDMALSDTSLDTPKQDTRAGNSDNCSVSNNNNDT